MRKANLITLPMGSQNQPWDNMHLFPLSDGETQALDKFLEDNIQTGQIHKSKSSWASPFFLFKKNDGSLCPVQD